MIKPRSAGATVVLAIVYVTSILLSSFLFPFLWGGFAFFMSFLMIPFFCLCVFAFYCGALCVYFGYPLDTRAPMLRVSPLALAMTLIAIPLAYRLSLFWGGPDVIGYIREHGL